jgi:hypothetical protein
VKYRLSAFITVLLMALFVSKGIAQNDGDQWLRVVTGEQLVIDVDRMSLVLEPNRTVRATFKTILSNPEPVSGRSVKLKTRVDTLQFNLKDSQYRVAETILSDSSGVTIYHVTNDDQNWRALGSSTGRRLSSAVRQLRPFGFWSVLSYRYATGEPPTLDDPTELTSLIGKRISLSWDNVQIGKYSCRSPRFESQTITNDEFLRRTGSPLTSLGISVNKVEAISFICEAQVVLTPQTLILRLPDGKALMSWEGVFFEIERDRNVFLP